MKQKKSSTWRLTLLHLTWYQFVRTTAWLTMRILFRISYRGGENIPAKGATVLVCNHQSFIDPPALGCSVWRHMGSLGRKTLFRFKPFGWMLYSIDVIPLDQEGVGLAGIKETLKRLKHSEMILIFPEGARSEDGQIHPFKPGYITLALRSQATIVPAAITGAFEAYPRGRLFPIPFWYKVRVEIGKPILHDDYKNLSEEEINSLVQNEVHTIFNSMQQKKL